MVLVQMLMDIDPLPMRGSLVTTLVMISPSGREVPLAKSLRQRAEALLPKFHLETAALRLESLLLFFCRAHGFI